MDRIYTKKLTILLFVFIYGISSGSFLSAQMALPEKNHLSQFIENYVFTLGSVDSFLYQNQFFSALVINSIFLGIIFFCNYHKIFMPVAYTILFYKGFCLGFSTSLIFDVIGIEECLRSMPTYLPQNAIIVTALALAILNPSFSFVKCWFVILAGCLFYLFT